MSNVASRRIAIWVLKLLPLAIIVFVSIFGVQSIMWWKVRKFGKSNPVLWVIPLALRDSAPSKLPGLKLSIYGYEFEVPWRDIDKDKTQSEDSSTIYLFSIRRILDVPQSG